MADSPHIPSNPVRDPVMANRHADAPQTDAPFRQPHPLLRAAGFLAAVLGWYVSIQLFSTSAGAPPGWLVRATCGGAAGDCMSALSSKYATLWNTGIPISSLGAGYFALLAAWFGLVGAPARRGLGWYVLPTIFVLAGAAVSVQLILAMAQMHAWCKTCLLAHGCNAMLLITTLAGWFRPPAARPHPSARLAVATLLAGLLLIPVHLLWVVAGMNKSAVQLCAESYKKIVNDPAYGAWDVQRQPKQEIPPSRDFSGKPDAPIRLSVFSDLTCPICAQLHTYLERVLANYPDHLRVDWYYYPLNRLCNEYDKQGVQHPGACDAARAVIAAARLKGQPAADTLRGRLFARNVEVDPLDMAALLRDTGMSVEQLRNGMNAGETGETLAADIALAHRLGVETMPAVFLDGRRLNGWPRTPDTQAWAVVLGILPPQPPASAASSAASANAPADSAAASSPAGGSP